jgi:hypothetical protein
MKKITTIKLEATKKSTSPDKVFKGYLSDSFPNKTENFKSRTFEVSEIDKDGTFKDFFSESEKQVMTIGEITEFCKNHKSDLRQDGWYTFFLFKEDDNFFVADVFVDDDGRLDVYVRPLEFGRVWSARSQHRVVVPQLPLKNLESSDPLKLEHFDPSEILERLERIETLLNKHFKNE